MGRIAETLQEFVAEILDVHPYYDEADMPASHARRLAETAQKLKQEIEALKPYQLSDRELAPKLAAFKQRAVQTGVWQPHIGQGADERIAFAMRAKKMYWQDAAESELRGHAIESLKYSGYLAAIRFDKQQHDASLTTLVNEFIEQHTLPTDIEKCKQDALQKKIIDISAGVGSERLVQAFPAGNFLYHGAEASQIIKVLASGRLVNARWLYDQEKNAAQTEGRTENLIRRNKGYEGVSWSLNAIDALPGDRYHLAGFVAAPETVLDNTQQLTIPSRPAPYEVIQVPADLDATSFYEAKTQFELYRNTGLMGESNSVLDNLLAVELWQDEKNHSLRSEPLLYEAQRGILDRTDYVSLLRRYYKILPGGRIYLSPDLLYQPDQSIPVAAVWLQAAIETGRFFGTELEGKDVLAIISALHLKNIKDVIVRTHRDYRPAEEVLRRADASLADIEVPVEQLWLLTHAADLPLWLKVLARCNHLPAGILLYDGTKVRLENFATLHRGDHEALTKQLRAVIPASPGYFEYAKVLGQDFTDNMRVGQKSQVVAEKFLTRRRAVVKVKGKLEVKLQAASDVQEASRPTVAEAGEPTSTETFGQWAQNRSASQFIRPFTVLRSVERQLYTAKPSGQIDHDYQQLTNLLGQERALDKLRTSVIARYTAQSTVTQDFIYREYMIRHGISLFAHKLDGAVRVRLAQDTVLATSVLRSSIEQEVIYPRPLREGKTGRLS